MSRSIRALVLFAVLLGAAAPALAEDAKKAEIWWTYERDGQQRDLNVTHMSDELRKSVDTQLRSKGWVGVFSYAWEDKTTRTTGATRSEAVSNWHDVGTCKP